MGVLCNYHHPSVHPSVHPLRRPFKGNRVFGWPLMKGFSNSAQSVAQTKARQRRNKKKGRQGEHVCSMVIPRVAMSQHSGDGRQGPSVTGTVLQISSHV